MTAAASESLGFYDILAALTGVNGISGDEKGPSAAAAEMLRPFGSVTTDHMGNIFCTIGTPGEGKPHLLFDAHLDEVGFMVTAVTDDGFLKVTNVGGIDRRLLMAEEVVVYSAEKPLYGVFCAAPAHLSDDEKKVPDFDGLYIDIGYSGEEAKKLVHPGDRVATRKKLHPLMGGQIEGKALDDRSGCAVLIKVAEALSRAKPKYPVTILLSAMEEVTGSGAIVGAYRAAPTHAIAIDVTHGYTPDASKEETSAMKGGPVIAYAPILCREVSDLLTKICREKNIPCQYEVSGRYTGTNADSIPESRMGVKCGVVSIPEKYMHTPCEVIALEDCEKCAELLTEYALRFGDNA